MLVDLCLEDVLLYTEIQLQKTETIIYSGVRKSETHIQNLISNK